MNNQFQGWGSEVFGNQAPSWQVVKCYWKLWHEGLFCYVWVGPWK